MPPPPAEPFASRIFLGPALRTQPDRRLVRLVREGYETAFEEIVRRYRKPLDRFAAAIVGARSEDVTQDAFSKALLALRGTTAEIELKPWLYRIVRNTALNELRDRPPATEELGEALTSGRSTAEEAERREEMTELMERLRALPEPQRAAIVMRELEGLSHEEIAAALGVSGGGARQAIYRARAALRNGFGMLIPLPLLRMLFDHGAEAAGAGGAAAAAGAASVAGGGGGATLGALGAGGALKVGVATALLAGSVGAGVAMQHDRGERGPEPAATSTSQLPGGGNQSGDSLGPGGNRGPLLSSNAVSGGDDGRGSDGDRHGGQSRGDDRGPGDGDTDDEDFEDSSHGAGPGHDGKSGHRGHGPSQSGHSGPRGGSDDGHPGEATSGSGHGGHPNSAGGGGDDGSGESGGSQGGRAHGAGSGGGESGGGGGSESRGHGGDSESSGGPAPAVSPPPVSEPPPEGGGVASEDGSESGSGSGSEGSGKDDS
jgi:RNA polymerase sigma factor (sigma-70 family)